MEEYVKYIVDEAISEQEQNGGFIIDTDEKAEWALQKISQEKTDCERMKAVCERMIESYKIKIEDAQTRYENNTSYLKGMLQRYMDTVKTKDSKTQKTYALPSGKLKIKYQQPEYVRDDEVLIKWLKENKVSYIKTKETPDWSNLKKLLSVSGEKVVDENGEIVEGVTVVEREPVFEVEV